MNKLSHLVLLTLSSSTLLTGCLDADAPQGDGIDDTFLGGGGKADGGISEGTPDAFGVLSVANAADKNALILEVGLVPETAEAIAAYRAGTDGVRGTADDQLFETLVQLDSVPYVGALAFERLLTFARAHGYAIDPFAASACDGPAIELGELRGMISAEGVMRVPAFTWTRQRDCDAEGCGPWHTPELLFRGEGLLATTFVADEALSFSAEYLETEIIDTEEGPTQHRTSYGWQFDLSTAPVPELSAVEGSYFLWMGPDVNANKAFHDVDVTFTNQCMRGVGRVFPELHNAPTVEQEIVFLARF